MRLNEYRIQMNKRFMGMTSRMGEDLRVLEVREILEKFDSEEGREEWITAEGRPHWKIAFNKAAVKFTGWKFIHKGASITYSPRSGKYGLGPWFVYGNY